MTDPEQIGRTLERFLAQMGAPPPETLSGLTSRWSEIVGPALAGRTRPIELLDGVLVVGCDDGGWASQIRWMDSQIKQRFAEIFGGAEGRAVIVRIQLRVG